MLIKNKRILLISSRSDVSHSSISMVVAMMVIMSMLVSDIIRIVVSWGYSWFLAGHNRDGNMLTYMIMVFRWVVNLLRVITWVIEDSCENISSVVKASTRASQDIGACTNHIRSESKLLAVQYKEVSVSV